jgi:hypothetical protein
MDDPAGSEARDRISRRKLLKRIGAGAAVAWTAPIITSMNTPAFAQGSAPEPCSPCAPFDCVNIKFCPQAPCASFCVERINGHCFCGPAVGWNNPPGPPICASDAECQFFAPGSVCVQMNPNCNASGNVGCAAPCPGSRIRSRPGMSVRRA